MELITLAGNRQISAPTPDNIRLAMLLWGAAGCGKTTLASTAPGVKLWILFDQQGTDSLFGRNDVMVLDLSGERHTIVERFKLDDPLGIELMLAKHPEIETVVFDSITSFAVLATENAVTRIEKASVENPTMQGWGHRSALVLRMFNAVMRLTRRTNKHIVFIAHEDTPQTNDKGHEISTTISLSGKMNNNIGSQLSEIWWMLDTGKERRIAVRPVRNHFPMKSRMWDLSGVGEFTWKYDPLKWEGDGIDKWFNAWKANGGRKLPIPK